MVALIKPETLTPRDSQLSTCNGRMRKSQPVLQSRQARPPLKTPKARKVFPKTNGEHVPVESAWAKAVPAVAAPDQASEPRSQERFSFDGDTTFMLYLREIGQV